MSEPAVAHVAARPKVLIVDDEPVNLRVLEAMLTPMGYECAMASDGGAGIAKAHEWNPDGILLDVMMPGMDGPRGHRRVSGRVESEQTISPHLSRHHAPRF